MKDRSTCRTRPRGEGRTSPISMGCRLIQAGADFTRQELTQRLGLESHLCAFRDRRDNDSDQHPSYRISKVGTLDVLCDACVGIRHVRRTLLSSRDKKIVVVPQIAERAIPLE